jgi:hypothetical protein
MAKRSIEPTVRKAHSWEDAAAWDVEQHVSLTPEERLRIARTIKDRVYPRDAKDVRAWHRSE